MPIMRMARAPCLRREQGGKATGETGIAAVAVSNSSHFGAAGAYALELARRGLGGLVFGNSDSLVRLHDGAKRFHGTNPISAAFPAAENPWLLDMATSSIPGTVFSFTVLPADSCRRPLPRTRRDAM